MKRHLFAAAAIACATLPSFALAESKKLDAGDIHAVDVSSGIKAIVTAGPALSVIAEASDPADLRDLRWEVRNGVLKVWYDWGIGNLLDFSGHDVTVTISAPAIDALEAGAGASIEASGISGDTVSIEVSSGASIKAPGSHAKHYNLESSSGAGLELSGSCETANVELSSGAGVSAKNLDCTNVTFEASSGAHLEITAHGSINAEVSSGGSATIYGKPSVEHLETSSGGSVDFPSGSP
ncbi:MAG: DUF2807 domain-containing protein [Devosia sp.]